MEWRGAQLNGAQYTHGMVHCVMYTGVPLQGPAQRGGPQAQRQMAAARRRRLRGDDALAAAREGARRRARRLPHERRDALSRERLSGADGAARLGGQHVGEVAAPHRGRRPALAHPRGDLEIHRPAGERPGAALHLSDGGEIRHHQSEPAGAAQPQVRLHGAVRHRLVGPRQDRARRRLARRRPQLAAGAGSTGRSGTRRWRASTTSSTGTAASCCCNRAPWTRPATCSRARPSCANTAASIRSTTTTASRPGTCRRTARSRMSRWA